MDDGLIIMPALLNYYFTIYIHSKRYVYSISLLYGYADNVTFYIEYKNTLKL